MMIHWSPCRDDKNRYAVDYTQPETDVLAIGEDYEVDLSDALIIEYAIPEQVSRWLLRAWREGGVLHVALVAFYTKADAGIWETRPFRGSEAEDYEAREALSWSDYDPRA